jgi:hypothetical protein
MADNVQFVNALTRELAGEAQLRALPAITSRTLQRALELNRQSASVISLHIPHYWAVFVHDGHGPVNMPPGKYMAAFRDPRLDPRLASGYPIRASQVKSLKDVISPAEFRQYLRSGDLILFTKRSRVEGAKWFDNEGNMRTFVVDAYMTARLRFENYVKRQLGDLIGPAERMTLHLGG